jgi:hypothetical protein
MPKYKVPGQFTQYETWIVEANSKDEAINKVYRAEGTVIEENEGDFEISYSEVEEYTGNEDE